VQGRLEAGQMQVTESSTRCSTTKANKEHMQDDGTFSLFSIGPHWTETVSTVNLERVLNSVTETSQLSLLKEHN
jgi:hypothetical protein